MRLFLMKKCELQKLLTFFFQQKDLYIPQKYLYIQQKNTCMN